MTAKYKIHYRTTELIEGQSNVQTQTTPLLTKKDIRHYITYNGIDTIESITKYVYSYDEEEEEERLIHVFVLYTFHNLEIELTDDNDKQIIALCKAEMSLL